MKARLIFSLFLAFKFLGAAPAFADLSDACLERVSGELKFSLHHNKPRFVEFAVGVHERTTPAIIGQLEQRLLSGQVIGIHVEPNTYQSALVGIKQNSYFESPAEIRFYEKNGGLRVTYLQENLAHTKATWFYRIIGRSLYNERTRLELTDGYLDGYQLNVRRRVLAKLKLKHYLEFNEVISAFNAWTDGPIRVSMEGLRGAVEYDRFFRYYFVAKLSSDRYVKVIVDLVFDGGAINELHLVSAYTVGPEMYQQFLTAPKESL